MRLGNWIRRNTQRGEGLKTAYLVSGRHALWVSLGMFTEFEGCFAMSLLYLCFNISVSMPSVAV